MIDGEDIETIKFSTWWQTMKDPVLSKIVRKPFLSAISFCEFLGKFSKVKIIHFFLMEVKNYTMVQTLLCDWIAKVGFDATQDW